MIRLARSVTVACVTGFAITKLNGAMGWPLTPQVAAIAVFAFIAGRWS